MTQIPVTVIANSCVILRVPLKQMVFSLSIRFDISSIMTMRTGNKWNEMNKKKKKEGVL